MNHFDEITCCEYLDGALQGSELAAFERHLGECGACRAMIEEARRGQADLTWLRLRDGPDLTPGLMAAVRALLVPAKS
nr:zf-HC2 domain-containing protein [Candidatus Ozemobacteraceae bacterium]